MLYLAAPKQYLMSEILTAITSENQEFFFKVTKNVPGEFHIVMYNTNYVLIKTEGGWVNKPENKLKMSQRLIDAVVEAVHAQVVH